LACRHVVVAHADLGADRFCSLLSTAIDRLWEVGGLSSPCSMLGALCALHQLLMPASSLVANSSSHSMVSKMVSARLELPQLSSPYFEGTLLMPRVGPHLRSSTQHPHLHDLRVVVSLRTGSDARVFLAFGMALSR
jgi:hypothetical protein